MLFHTQKGGKTSFCLQSIKRAYLTILLILQKVEVPPVGDKDCGYSNPNGLKLTLDNTMRDEAQRFEFPWMVSIRARTYADSPFHSIGGGALVSTNVVLTTAHRVIEFEPNNIMIRAGEWDTDNEKEFLPHVDVVVDRRIVHENFSNITGINNVALLILKKRLDRDEHIGTICLPLEVTQFDNEQCIVMGWGKKKADSLEYPNILKKVRLPYLNNQQCQPMLRRTQLGRYYELHHSLLCAGGEEGRDACVGDGGSPLVCPIKDYPDRYQVVGLVNFGLGCGDKDVPGVYTNVQMLLSWIKRNLHLSYAREKDYTY